ncbi:MAG: hypothetical protein WCL57_16645 [Chloroflexota bacterium]|jgi:plasmid maintenance system antidote protein VapI|nr:hypothetical protein [Chloroflexota bacterium]
MTNSIRVTTHHAPTHPDEMLLEEFLAKFFGMSAKFWLKLQLRWDLYHAQQAEQETLETIHRYIAVAG